MNKNLEFISLPDDSEDNFGRFIIKPLNLGMGVSIGNIFRRLLLTQMIRTNITGVRIAGITNEFSTIPGVREDILEILLNLRQVILKSSTQEKTYARVKIQGPAIITANCFQLDSACNVSIINPKQYIATITDNSILELELKIESGRDCNLANNQTIIESSDFLRVDQISSPVRKVIFTIIDRSEKENKEELLLKVWTDGSITPIEAVIATAELLQAVFTNINFKTLKIL